MSQISISLVSLPFCWLVVFCSVHLALVAYVVYIALIDSFIVHEKRATANVFRFTRCMYEWVVLFVYAESNAFSVSNFWLWATGAMYYSYLVCYAFALYHFFKKWNVMVLNIKMCLRIEILVHVCTWNMFDASTATWSFNVIKWNRAHYMADFVLSMYFNGNLTHNQLQIRNLGMWMIRLLEKWLIHNPFSGCHSKVAGTFVWAPDMHKYHDFQWDFAKIYHQSYRWNIVQMYM